MSKIALFTVHGTFAPNADWVEASSDVMKTVVADCQKDGTSVDVIPLRWSGTNSFEARKAGARALATVVDAKLTSPEYDAVLILAHSHGGTVAAQAAIDYPEIMSRVSGLVTLSTPFISVIAERFALANRRHFARIASAFLLIGLVLTFTPIITVLIAGWSLPEPPPSIYAGNDPLEDGSMFRDPLFAWSILGVAVELLVSFAVGALLGCLWSLMHLRWMRNVTKSEAVFSEKLEAYGRGINTAGAKLPKTIVVVPTRDEASSGLGALQWTNTVFREMVGRLGRIAVPIESLPSWLRFILSIGAFIGLAMLAVGCGMWGAHEGRSLVFYTMVVIGLVLTLLGLVIFASVITGLAFGSFSLFAQAYCRFGVQNSPIGSHEVVLVDTSTENDGDLAWNGSTLNHSTVYMFAEGIQAISSSVRKLNSMR